MRALSNTQELLERTIELALLELTVSNGYLPNRNLFLSNPAGYETAKAAIRNSSKKFCIEIFGAGSPHDRDLKTIPRIVINSGGFYPADTGNAFGPVLSKNINTPGYSLQVEAPRFSNYRFEISLVSKSSSQDRVLESIRQASLVNMSYLTLYTSNNKVLIEQTFTRDVSDSNTGLIEKVYGYEAKDVMEQFPEVIKSDVAKIRDIQIKDPNNNTLIRKRALFVQINENVSVSESTSNND